VKIEPKILYNLQRWYINSFITFEILGGVVLKNIVIFTMGTRGDVQPYIYLAQALIKERHRVTIGTHPCWKKLVNSAMIEFTPIGPDIDIEYEAAAIRGRTKNPVFSMLKTMKFVFNIIKNSSKDIYESCRSKDLVIVSHSQMGATEAEVLDIETINVTLQTEMIPEVNRKKTLRDKVFGALINPQMVRPYNEIRKLYHLPKVKSMDEVMSPKLNLIPISRYIIEQNPYWDKKNKIVGYWYNDDSDYEPEENLKAFLSAGVRPIILALGAMSFESKKEKEKLNIFVNAFQKTGMRAIIQGFNKTLADYQLPETMISVGSIPHSWLFKQGYCVIHHCGFGTSASSLLYSIPTISVPHVLDQFAFAEHLYKLKVSVKPIKASELSEEKLISAINELKANYSEIHNRVEDLAKKMQEENGLENAVRLIESAVDAH
jgi:UDP:flavonoid glycosyltransferase YjiC (YdhE family)